jgi:hypothetical protein
MVMILEKLYSWPSKKTLKLVLVLSLIGFIIVIPLMMFFFLISGFPVDFTTSQLSFSGEKLKEWYSVTTDLGFYRVAQLCDYGFMTSYGLLAFSLALIIGRKYEEPSKWAKSASLIAIIGVLSAVLDAVENALILVTLTDPLGFSNGIAILHSFFALFKYICLISAIGWAVIAGINLLIKRRSK